MKVTIWQVCSRHIQHRIVPRGLRRDPSPRRIDHLYHTPVTLCDHPTPRAPNQLVARLNIEHQSIWGASHAHQMEALQTDGQITPIITIKRHRTAAGRVRHRPRSLDDSGGRSPLIIKDLDLYPQPPTNTRSPTLNSEEPFKSVAEELPGARAVMDPFHVVYLAGNALDECRRCTGQELHHWRGRATDPLYKARRVLHTRSCRLTARQQYQILDLFSSEEHVALEVTWSVYQNITRRLPHARRERR